ncbi:hypothetical protein Palpr_1562 [Paludibacter propionicigenes WB4]|uniref:NVEALA family protein n=1 Tax=Paludibacter propionicigenes (strain DSM 17365 / JCM 13257 / WB4) TaxID=694427 RepID=E4T4R3_PALPW|nr:NVEALA domain-containing protein [Paludibacter propionicigenes]ADQ79707.1 hypothetical protein Palpr_1562 [Paludibacter propionicigenes WB4]
MKKNFFGALLVVAIAVGAMMNVNLNKTSNKGNLALAEVEALADGERGCNSVGWWNDNGNCVSNGTLYFCAEPLLLLPDDCKY